MCVCGIVGWWGGGKGGSEMWDGVEEGCGGTDDSITSENIRGFRKSWTNTMLHWEYGESECVFAALRARQIRPFLLGGRGRS